MLSPPQPTCALKTVHTTALTTALTTAPKIRPHLQQLRGSGATRAAASPLAASPTDPPLCLLCVLCVPLVCTLGLRNRGPGRVCPLAWVLGECSGGAMGSGGEGLRLVCRHWSCGLHLGLGRLWRAALLRIIKEGEDAAELVCCHAGPCLFLFCCNWGLLPPSVLSMQRGVPHIVL